MDLSSEQITNNKKDQSREALKSSKMPQEFYNGDIAVDVKIEAEETTIIDVDLDEPPTFSNTDPPDSTVSLGEGSGDERKTKTGRVKRKAALNIRTLNVESDDTDSDYSQEDGSKDPPFDPQLQGKLLTPKRETPVGRRGKQTRSSDTVREAKVPKLQIRTDIGVKSSAYVAFTCDWGQCEHHFEAISDCWEHIFSNHLRSACLPDTETLRVPVKCGWKGCSRAKHCALPFAKFSHLTRHVSEAHPLRSQPIPQSRAGSYYPHSGL